MFAKRIVTKAVERSVLFCDACMCQVDPEEDFVVTSFTLLSGQMYSKREAKKVDKYIICRKCYETIAGAYETHKQLIADGQESTFHREGITEQEMKALFQYKKEKEEQTAEKKRPWFKVVA